ncbi:hypothetical protein PG997_002603 [Apiospora hydei]|uniref:DUF924-domain-containing protein n=1 Tax=Apiospora hydei TaxID=1337664 RepID=A0ABR1WWX3_9PEZI
MSSVNTNPDVKRIMSFWFDRNPIEWIIAPEGLDSQIKTDFGDLVLKARRNELDDWNTESPESSVALVVLLDQFCRNIFRGTPDAFSGDAKAHEVATKAIARGFHKQVTVIQTSAFYMSLLSSESLIFIVAARCLWDELKTRCETKQEHDWVDMGIKGTDRHMEQLDQFGRYPTRNKLLGRENTEAEEKFLKEYNPTL